VRRIIVVLAVMAIGIAVGSGVALSAPALPPDAEEEGGSPTKIVGGEPVPDGKYPVTSLRSDSRPSLRAPIAAVP
jgi:hypothetical protein